MESLLEYVYQLLQSILSIGFFALKLKQRNKQLIAKKALFHVGNTNKQNPLF